jgi:adenosylmethionine---8-amino-7-oxononanoate aminotransferase
MGEESERDSMRRDSQTLWRPYCQMKTAGPPYEVVAAEGIYLQLADGRRLIDGVSSWWTACHGHRHSHLVEAVKQQIDVLPHVMLGGIVHPQAARLCTRLAALAPGDLNHVFLVDSGSVAIEVAMKMAVQYWLNQGVTGRNRFVSFRDGYHGDTSGAMSLCDPEDSMHAHFQGFLQKQFCTAIPDNDEEFGSFAQLLNTHRSEIAAVVVEPLVQAAGGFRMHTPAQLRRIAELTRTAGCLLIADEIATGFGRTGKMFAVEHAGVVPDIMCMGKGLSGGMMSLAATVATRDVFSAFWSDDPQFALMHGPTYMGNPLACAAANASLDLFETEPRLDQVAKIECTLRESLEPLRHLPQVLDVRVRGAIGVVQMKRVLNKEQWMKFFVERGVWLRPTRDVFYIAPPFAISKAELECLTAAVISAVESMCA